MQKYAVITGDFVSSSKLDNNERDELFTSLKEIFTQIELNQKYSIDKPFEISRGDFFQGIIIPQFALEVALLIFTQIRKFYPDNDKKEKLTRFTPYADLRLSIGIGEISYSKDKIIESDGEAFRNSGRYLDKNEKKGPRIMIKTPLNEINEELEVYAWLLDAIINKWSIKSAEVVNNILKNKKQSEIAQELNISQPSVTGRLDAANWDAIEKLLNRYNNLMKNLQK